MKKLSYEDIVEYLNNSNQDYILLTNKEDFDKLCVQQNTSPLYTKLDFKCVNCGRKYSRSLACMKAIKSLGICKSCSSKFPTRKYEEIIDLLKENGYTPLFSKEEYTGVKMKACCIARCGHEICTTIDSMLHRPTGMCRKCTNAKERAYNWKGGYSSEREAFRGTYEFKQFIKEVLKRDNYTCVNCGKKSRETKIVVHHKDSYNWCKERRTDIDNGVTLCENCHKEFHKIYGQGNNTEYQFKEWINIDNI